MRSIIGGLRTNECMPVVFEIMPGENILIDEESRQMDI